MDKSLELKLFRYVYGDPAWLKVAPSEKPDFLYLRNDKCILGVEVTELFTNKSDARLNKIDGYSGELLNGGDFRHKDDKVNIEVDRVKYIKKGENDGPEIDAIISELPKFPERVSLLANTIDTKEEKYSLYAASCPIVDLIINDASNLFWFDKFENLIVPLSRLIDKKIIVDSKFRKIFLITASKENSKVKIPLRLNFFAQDITILEKLIFDRKKDSKISDPNRAMKVLVYCLYRVGYRNVSLILENHNLGFVIGCHLYLYAKEGKNIRDYSTIHDELPTGESIYESKNELDDSEKGIAEKILEDKNNYRSCINLFMKVE